jgi:hypothetical protein
MSVDAPVGSTNLPAFPPPPRGKRKWPIYEYTPQTIAGLDTASRVYPTCGGKYQVAVYPTCGGKYQVGFTRLAAPSITEFGQARVPMQPIIFQKMDVRVIGAEAAAEQHERRGKAWPTFRV